MRKVNLIFLLTLISHTCIAPVTDFRLKLAEFRLLEVYVDKSFHESEFTRFINDLGYRESANNWVSINLIGCFGEWQFAESTLKYLGFKKITLKKFKASRAIFPREMQIKALETLIKVNLAFLRNYEHFIGNSVRGVRITKSGMIAASHLGGAGALKKFLDTNGKINHKDVLGTSIYDYLKKFHNYDLE